MVKNENIIGERLKYLRKTKKMKVDYITNKIDIARSTYNGYEAGTRKPDPDKLVQFATLFNTTVDYITGKTENPSPTNDLYELLESNELVYNGKKIKEQDQAMIARIISSFLSEENKTN